MPEVADDCIPQLFVCRTRVSSLAADGTPTGTPYVSDALQKATLTPVYDAGDEVKEKNGCGSTFIDVLSDPTFVRCDLSLDFLTPDPYLHAVLLSQGTLLTGAFGAGFAFPPLGAVIGNGISVELFTGRYDAGALSQVHPYAVWALPRVTSMALGARDFTNAAQHSIITGQCLENANWGSGPGAGFTAASDRVAQWIPVAALPAATCGPSVS